MNIEFLCLFNAILISITTVYHLMSVLQGTNLDQIRLELDDVVIKIGKSECYVTSTGRQLTCRPPKEQPIPMKSMLYPEVEVGMAVCSVNESLDASRFLKMFRLFFIFFEISSVCFFFWNICIYL